MQTERHRADRELFRLISSLSPAKVAEVRDFVKFLKWQEVHADEDELLVWAGMKMSEEAFAEVWDNPEDAAVYDRR